MTRQNNNTVERDDVLFAFHSECQRPTAKDITEWTARYPQFADDIRDHAEILNEWATSEYDESEVNESTLARGRSSALNILYQVRQESAQQKSDSESDSENWSQLVSRAGFNIPRLARTISIDRKVLAELNAGRMRLPIGKRLANALSDVLNVPIEKLNAAISQLLARPMRLGHAKADGPPTIKIRTYEEVIRASPMPPEEQSYWLDEN